MLLGPAMGRMAVGCSGEFLKGHLLSFLFVIFHDIIQLQSGS